MLLFRPMKIVNLMGLVMVTVGALLAIVCAPAPTYNLDGSVSLAPGTETSKVARIRMHYYQKFGLPLSFGLIALGSSLQLYVAVADL